MEVIYDAEHFFDGYKNNPEYALANDQKSTGCRSRLDCLCDTNGGSLPGEITAIVTTVTQHVSTPVGIHAHNDCELGVANSLAAVQAGASQVQGTINGYGERCGNANLAQLFLTYN